MKTPVLAGLLFLLITGLLYFYGPLRTNTVYPSHPVSDSDGVADNFSPAVVSYTDKRTLSSLSTEFPIREIKRYTIPIADGMEYRLDVAAYRSGSDVQNQAIVYLPAETDDSGKVVDRKQQAAHYRFEKWHAASDAILRYTDKGALFVSFWDNAQRIHLYTGRENWVSLPEAAAYGSSREQSLWKDMAGGFDTSGRMARFSQLLLMDLDEALLELRDLLPSGHSIYLLLSTDDLSHIQEIARMNGQGLPLETRLFPADSDLHNSISRVKEWAGEGEGTGSYLAQSVSERTIRVWRVTDPAFENSMLVRLLPFSTSHERPLAAVKLVYQSDWGGFISIYQLTE
ncbi:MAG: hypothetical protein MI673_07720 [Thiotrichales bacterium]|nr:hypothetical protein [Thiotrichales bacterium]